MSEVLITKRDLSDSRLSSSREMEILHVAREILFEKGIGGLTMDEVAKCARCSKSTLYRRWRDKTEIVVAIVEANPVKYVDFNYGSLREDLKSFLTTIANGFDAKRGKLFLAIALEMQTNKDMAEAWKRGGLIRGREIFREIVARAKARGEITGDPDLPMLFSLLPGTFTWSLFVEKVKDKEKLVRTLVDNVVIPFLKSY